MDAESLISCLDYCKSKQAKGTILNCNKVNKFIYYNDVANFSLMSPKCYGKKNTYPKMKTELPGTTFDVINCVYGEVTQV